MSTTVIVYVFNGLLLLGHIDPRGGMENQLTDMLSGSMASQPMLAAVLTRASMMSLTSCCGSPNNQEPGWNRNVGQHHGRRGRLSWRTNECDPLL